MTPQQQWTPSKGESVNYYGSLRAFHGGATILFGPYPSDGADPRYRIECTTTGEMLNDVRRQSIFPLYTPETEPEAITETWCGYCAQTQRVNKTTGRVRVHSTGSGRCAGSGKLPRFTIEHLDQTPFRDRPWIVQDNATGGCNMCNDLDAPDRATNYGWFATYADARKAMTLRELEGFTYSGETCVNCICAIESNGYDYRHLNRKPGCYLGANCTAEPEGKLDHAAA